MSRTVFEGLPPDPDHLVPGSFFLRKIDGWTGRWVSAAQAFVRGGSGYTHAGMVLDDGTIIEAEPGGANIKPATTLWDHVPVLISDAPVQQWAATRVFPQLLGAKEEATLIKRAEICGKARYMQGVPYSFLDYLAIMMVEFKVPGASYMRARVESSEHLICSALVDRVYSWCDIHLFDDGRLPGDVTPWDLEHYVLRFEGARMIALASGYDSAEGAPTYTADAL